MSNERKAIRHAVRDLLDGTTDAEDRVYASRILPLKKHTLPVITVYTLDETVDADSVNTAPRELTRNLSLVIEAWVSPGEDPDDRMDDFAQQIEDVMHADPYLGGAVGESVLESTETELLIEGDREMGLVILTYAITYRTLAPAAPEDLDDFERARVVHNLANAVHEDDRAVDEFEVQEAAS
jgi:hypothetical protein